MITIRNAILSIEQFDSSDWQRRPQRHEILFSGRDRGKGIPANRLESIFNYFQQLDDPMTRENGGTALGLAIRRTIV